MRYSSVLLGRYAAIQQQPSPGQVLIISDLKLDGQVVTNQTSGVMTNMVGPLDPAFVYTVAE